MKNILDVENVYFAKYLNIVDENYIKKNNLVKMNSRRSLNSGCPVGAARPVDAARPHATIIC